MKAIILLVLVTIVSCSTQVTKEGKKVRLVTNNQKEKYCEPIDIVTASNSVGWDAGHDRENAMNEVRNKVASLGGNAMKIITSTQDSDGAVMFSSGIIANASEAVIQAEALKCDFPKKKK